MGNMYLLDANTYIQAKNLYYQLDFCPAYWDFLDQQFKTGMLASIDNVYDELSNTGDDLANWVREHKMHFHPIESEQVQQQYIAIVNHIAALPNKSRASVDAFLDSADPWLIATATLTGEVVVTQEVLVAHNSHKIKIPNVCKEFSVQYMDTFHMLKELKARFVLP